VSQCRWASDIARSSTALKTKRRSVRTGFIGTFWLAEPTNSYMMRRPSGFELKWNAPERSFLLLTVASHTAARSGICAPTSRAENSGSSLSRRKPRILPDHHPNPSLLAAEPLIRLPRDVWSGPNPETGCFTFERIPEGVLPARDRPGERPSAKILARIIPNPRRSCRLPRKFSRRISSIRARGRPITPIFGSWIFDRGRPSALAASHRIEFAEPAYNALW